MHYIEGMRTSSRKTTPAVLRSILGIKDVEMAELLGCSTSTIHSVESGRLKLSESLALRMSLVTGVNVDWLLDGDTSKPPTTIYQARPYSRSEFEHWLLSKTETLRVDKMQRAIDVIECFGQLRAILESANKRGDYIMARYKLHVAIEALRDQFGLDLSSVAETSSGNGRIPLTGRRDKLRLARFGSLPLKAIKVVEGTIADIRAFITACDCNAIGEWQSPKRRRSKRPFGRQKSKA
jgi:transcriptional regulator with XRE-family HTH domain